MVPTWVPKWSRNGPKIDQKINKNSDAIFDGFGGRFWTSFGTKTEASWHQNADGMERKFEKLDLHPE